MTTIEKPLSVLFGSQTGNAEEVAWDLYREARERGFAAVEPQALDEVELKRLPSLATAVFVVSTTGQGDMPLNMRKFWQDLTIQSLPADLLENLKFAVFGLGDTHYREYNYAARKLFARLKNLGAQPIYRLGLGDDQHDFGFEQELDPWSEGLWEDLTSHMTPRNELKSSKLDCRFTVKRLGEKFPVGNSVPEVGDFRAIVRSNYSMCSADYVEEQQDVRHMDVELPEGETYEAGDVLVIWPQADAALVERFVVETLEMSLDEVVEVLPVSSNPSGGSSSSTSSASSAQIPSTPITLRGLFTHFVDIAAVPSRHFFYVLSEHTPDELHAKKLREFSSKTLEAKDALYEYCKRERRSAAEVMWDFWTARPPLAELLSCLPLMRPRRYSIASSPTWASSPISNEAVLRKWLRVSAAQPALWQFKEPPTPTQASGDVLFAGLSLLRRPWTWPSTSAAALAASAERPFLAPSGRGQMVGLCVGIVKYITRTAREGTGLCSGYMSKMQIDAPMRCGLEKGSLGPLPVSVPMIMVCPGTGLSPCRSLAQDRHLKLSEANLMSSGRFVAGRKDLLFLGFRHQKGDYLYSDDWETFKPWLSVNIAFSRDHEDKKVYVQDLIEENGKAVCDLLDLGARIFVCGKAHPMPSQVFDSFVEVLEVHRKLSKEDATNRLRMMQRSQRYICDTWG